jgi:hypothetical protein
MPPLPTEVNSEHNVWAEKVVKSEIGLDLPLKITDLVYKFQWFASWELKLLSRNQMWDLWMVGQIWVKRNNDTFSAWFKMS